MDQQRLVTRRPEGVPDAVVEAIGKASEALEYVERARGHLFSLHQLIGRADLLFEEAAQLLRDASTLPAASAARIAEDAEALRRDIVGRNVLDGRWTFQIVEEFDDLYYEPVRDAVRALEVAHLDGQRHVWESEMKEKRRSNGLDGHERRPPAAHASQVETDG